MNRKPLRPSPKVDIIRKGVAPVVPRPRADRPVPSPSVPLADRVAELARRERVPLRIARGELDGKMKCRVWRKLHAVEAQRFTQAYELMERVTGVDLADAFGIIQSGKTPEQFLARKARLQQKQEIHTARGNVDRSQADALFQRYIAARNELAIVLGTQTLLDILIREEPIALELERHQRVEKLQVVLITSRTRWEELSPKLSRDSRLSKKPLPVPREPERRPLADPRPFLDLKGQRIELQLRNGIQITEPLLGVGPFDLILGKAGAEILVPLHAVVGWKPP